MCNVGQCGVVAQSWCGRCRSNGIIRCDGYGAGGVYCPASARQQYGIVEGARCCGSTTNSNRVGCPGGRYASREACGGTDTRGGGSRMCNCC
ncbi:MAG: hypothetical protein LW711_15395 [Saprospiraceae bacterium]|nr:hypothetical protein [Saprospiraceae bacterium]